MKREELKFGLTTFFLPAPLIENKYSMIWGFPLKEDDLLKNEWTDSVLNTVSGYFIAIRNSNNVITIVNDILGGYRLYYAFINNKWFFSDDYLYLLNKLEHSATKDGQQLKYWENHRYTLNSGTLFNEIKKLPPATRAKVIDNGLVIESYFSDYPNTPNYNLMMEKGYEVITEQLLSAYLHYNKSKFILFYSGGADSTFLLLTLQKLHIPFLCVLIRYKPRWSISEKEHFEAKSKLSILGINDYYILDVDLNEALKNHIDTAKKEMLFDRHTSVHFYETYKRVKEVFGTDIVIVNGQSADSILSFGPSDLIPGFFVRRCILYSNWFTNLFLEPIVRVYLSNKFRLPWTKRGKLRSVLDEYEYFFVLRRNCPYLSLLNSELESSNFKRIKHFHSQRMYAKIISFLQGPDNQIVIRAANHFGINKVIMPFTAPAFIYDVIKYKDDFHEILKGKYFVRDYIKKVYGLNNIKVKGIGKMPSNDFDMKAFSNSILKIYNNYLDELISK